MGSDIGAGPFDVGIGPADFMLKVGNGGSVDAWGDAPAPVAITVRRGAGVDGSDRVTLVFADNVIENIWLRVTVLANERTGLARPDVFYFASLVGDAGDAAPAGGGPTRITVGARDLFSTRRGYTGSAPAALTDVNDHNRDGKVNALDLALTRGNFFRTLAPFAPATPAGPGPPAVRPHDCARPFG